MNFIRTGFLLFLIIAFFAGLYVYLFNVQYQIETFRNDQAGYVGPDDGTSKCPNLLISSGANVLLYNTTIPEIPGKNPIIFDSLDDYIQYLEVQKQNGQDVCPVLYLQQEVDAQGKDVYRIQPKRQYWEQGLPPIYDPTNNQILSPNHGQVVPIRDADRLNPPYNANNYPGFDPQGLYNGVRTDLDKRHQSTATTSTISDNPMDENWGGVSYTQAAVDSGKYAGEEVVKPLTTGRVNTSFLPIDYSLGKTGFDYGVGVTSPQQYSPPPPSGAVKPFNQ